MSATGNSVLTVAIDKIPQKVAQCDNQNEKKYYTRRVHEWRNNEKKRFVFKDVAQPILW
jgi:hypothetical protein